MRIDKWELLGTIAAIFNPIPTGILAGYFLHRDKYKAGKYIMAFSIAWAVVLIYFLTAMRTV
ncbi:MAG: hypothetical protein HY514_03995 [Candidatus Aenigmarchaeota archaeon]|nr:hypothetical protein [Candidatus Aenigmarchaeota archaeon]